ATSRWKTAAWAASCSAGSPARAAREQFSKWAAARPRAARVGSRKPPCAASGRPIAPRWVYEDRMTGHSSLEIVTRAQTAYARCIDSGDLEAGPDFFENACIYKITTADTHRQGLEAGLVFANSRAMLVDRITSLREANIYERHSYRHILGQPWIVAEDGETVS